MYISSSLSIYETIIISSTRVWHGLCYIDSMKTLTVKQMNKEVQAKIEAQGFQIVWTMFKNGTVVVCIK